ncbi:MAG: glycosyltransferase family 4 protein [Bacteroidales bacterium]|nr:glycosyltransferase family 4 protein [Bacteroidales bacterium]
MELEKPVRKKLRIAAFGFRSIPYRQGCAGADKFAIELFPRLVKAGHQVTGYNRLYPGQEVLVTEYEGIRLVNFKTVNKTGFDTLLHSMKCTFHIIFRNTADIVHIQNGGNSIWGLFLRLAGKKVFISQDGIDWNRDKWPWYGKTYLRMSTFITGHVPNQVIFDNIFAREVFEKKFKKKYEFIPFGSEVPAFADDDAIFNSLGLNKKEYYLFIGRMIPDKGLHYLIPAFKRLNTNKKLVLVGGSPNPSDYEKQLREMANDKVLFTGYIYGDDSLRLMKNAYCYIQPSDIEGLSPVILNVMGLGTPILCSDIPENLYAVGETATLFKKSNTDSLYEQLTFIESGQDSIRKMAEKAQSRALNLFNWDQVARDHENVFQGLGIQKS